VEEGFSAGWLFLVSDRKKLPPWNFHNPKWCYRSAGGQTFVQIFQGKKPVAGFFWPLAGFRRAKWLKR
jgi:hypothetical protein